MNKKSGIKKINEIDSNDKNEIIRMHTILFLWLFSDRFFKVLFIIKNKRAKEIT